MCQAENFAAGKQECWNWQTGMTKDHVCEARVGSSPISCSKKTRFEASFFVLFFRHKNSLIKCRIRAIMKYCKKIVVTAGSDDKQQWTRT